MQPIARRTLLAAAASAAAASPGTAKPIRLGGPIFLKSDDPDELAREHRRLGYSAAYCPPANPNDTARTRAIERAFAARDVLIAEVGAWRNMLDPDSEKRRANMDYVIERMALAEAVAARCCVNIAGSYHPRIWFGPHPKNLSREFFDATVENCRRVIDAIKPKRSTFSIEMMPWSLPDGPESYLALMKAVDRRQFSVHIDICNVVNSPERFYNHAHLIVRCFRLLGAKTSSCHAKDLDWATEYNIHFREVGPGKGQIDYRTYLREVAPTGAPLMLEHLKTPEEYEEAKNHILSLGKELGLTFA